MADRKILRRLIRHLGVGVDEGRIWIVEDVGVGLIFHHDEEDMIQMSEAALGPILVSGVSCSPPLEVVVDWNGDSYHRRITNLLQWHCRETSQREACLARDVMSSIDRAQGSQLA